MGEIVRYDVAGRVATLTLDRPERYNAIDDEMPGDLRAAVEAMGLERTQTLATLFDGIARHIPEGVAFKKRCEEVGFEQAVAERDRGDLFDT